MRVGEWCRQRDRAGGMYVCMGVEEEKPRVGRRRGETMTMTKIGVRVVSRVLRGNLNGREGKRVMMMISLSRHS